MSRRNTARETLPTRRMLQLLAAGLAVAALAGLPGPVPAQRLFVGLEEANLVTKSSDLSGFPNVQYTNHFPFAVNGAAATPEDLLYLSTGDFTTQLYRSTLNGPPQLLTTTAVDLQGLGYGRGRLYGFSNFASPMGIYDVNTATGAATLVVSTSTPGFRFFGLDYNTVDDLLYGYTEYGVTGLYSVNIDTGVMTRIVAPPPNVNGQGRALAVGNNTVYLMATRGDEGEPCFAYDLAQGVGGSWVAFTNPYPTYHSTGGATWLPGGQSGLDQRGDGSTPGLALAMIGPNPFANATDLVFTLPRSGSIRLEIFDLLGRSRGILADGEFDAGRHVVAWNPACPAGIYLVRVQAGNEARSLKLALTR